MCCEIMSVICFPISSWKWRGSFLFLSISSYFLPSQMKRQHLETNQQSLPMTSSSGWSLGVNKQHYWSIFSFQRLHRANTPLESWVFFFKKFMCESNRRQSWLMHYYFELYVTHSQTKLKSFQMLRPSFYTNIDCCSSESNLSDVVCASFFTRRCISPTCH